MSIPSSQQVLNIKDAGPAGDGVDGVWRQIKCGLTGIKYSSAVTVEKEPTLCGVTKSPGEPDNSFTFTGLYEDNGSGADITTLHQLFRRLQRGKIRTAFQYGPNGDATGDTLISGFGYVTNYNIDGQADTSIKIDGAFEVDGDDQDAVWP